MVQYLFWPMDASFVQTGECSPFTGTCSVVLQLHPMAFLYIFYVCRYTRVLSFIFVVGTISLSIFLVILSLFVFFY